MNFLPIVERELRVASRRKSTYRIRGMTATIAAAVSLFFLLFFAIVRQAQAGQNLFMILSWYAFVLCILAGVFITSDSLTEEKQQGTLGLLFLTDLKGYDVVLGKFMATSLNALYGLVAMLPILAMPMLMGGVTGAEYWRMVLALGNALFFSLALGIFVSACSRDSQRALSGTLGWLFLLAVAFPSLNHLLAFLGPTTARWGLPLFSPFHPFLFAFANYYTTTMEFVVSLTTSHFLGWVFIALASRILPRSWQDQPFKSDFAKPGWRWNKTGRIQNIRTRQKLLEQNAIQWLMSGGTGWRWGIWILVFVTVVVAFFIPRDSFVRGAGKLLGTVAFVPWLLWPLLFVLKVMIAMRATMFFAESRRNGAMELILSTPLRNDEIVRGQWLALKRLFFWPVTIIVLVQLISLLFFTISQSSDYFTALFLAGGIGIYGLIKFVLDIITIIWVGMWMGLSSKNPNRATVWTILLTVILPSALLCVPDVLIDLILILWAKGRTERDIRAFLTGDRATLPPPKDYNKNYAMT